MNHFINFLIIKNYYLNSPIFLINELKNFRNINIFNTNFFNSFSPFLNNYKINLNLNLNKNKFNNILNRVIKITKLSIINIRIEYITPGNITINNVLFENCDVKGKAGILFISSTSINLYFSNSAFLKCTTSGIAYNAGGLVIQGINLSNIKNLCFERCSSDNEPTSYQIISHERDIKITEFNFTTEYLGGNYKYQSRMPSIIGGNNYLKYFNNNISVIIGIFFGGGFGYSRSTIIYSKYNQISNCFGTQMLLNMIISKNYIIENKNFINNTVSDSWIRFYSSSLILTFENCFFYQFSQKRISLDSINIIFNNCFFEKEILSSNLIHCQINSNCLFNSTLNNKISLNLLNTLICWNKLLINKSIKFNFFKFKIL